jgi:D-inositol-3-phosphate glycosyltransferase
MNITILCTSAAWGGLEILTTKIALWFSVAHNITVLCPPDSRAARFCEKNRIKTINFAPKSKYADLRAINSLKHIIGNQDILLISESKDINLAVLARKFARFGNKAYGCKLVYMQNMQVGIDKKDFIHTYFYRNLDAWISPLNLLKANTLQRTKMPANKIHIIPFGIETEQLLNNQYTQTAARKILQLPEEALIAGVMGRLDPGKGQEFLVRAIATLKERGKILHAAIIGEETLGDKRQYLQYLKNLSKELKITDLVHFCPFQQDISLAYAALDIFVMPSIGETYGLVTLEAMASALPVVASFAGGTRELIKDRETGLFFESENAIDLAEKLTEMIDNQSFRQKISKQAQIEAIEVFDYRKQIRAMENLFLSL